MDLIAFKNTFPGIDIPTCLQVLDAHGYISKHSESQRIPLLWLASKIEKKYIKHVYWEVVTNYPWIVVLMQCKINKRKLKRK